TAKASDGAGSRIGQDNLGVRIDKSPVAERTLKCLRIRYVGFRRIVDLFVAVEVVRPSRCVGQTTGALREIGASYSRVCWQCQMVLCSGAADGIVLTDGTGEGVL